MDIEQWRNSATDLEGQISTAERRLQLAGRGRADRDKRQIKAKIPGFQNEVTILSRAIEQYTSAPRKYNNINDGDITACQSRLNSIKNKLQSLDDICSRDNDNNATSALLGDRRKVKDSEQTQDLTNQQLYQDHLAQTVREDQALDRISVGLTGLKSIAETQNKHLTQHGQLLDDLHHTIDITDDSLDSNIKRVDIVEEKTRGGWASILIMILLLVLIVLTPTTNIWCFLPQAKGPCV